MKFVVACYGTRGAGLGQRIAQHPVAHAGTHHNDIPRIARVDFAASQNTLPRLIVTQGFTEFERIVTSVTRHRLRSRSAAVKPSCRCGEKAGTVDARIDPSNRPQAALLFSAGPAYRRAGWAPFSQRVSGVRNLREDRQPS